MQVMEALLLSLCHDVLYYKVGHKFNHEEFMKRGHKEVRVRKSSLAK
jgi:hypothetical protein